MTSLDPAAIAYYSPLRTRLREEVLAAEHKLARLSQEMVEFLSPDIMAQLPMHHIVHRYAYRPAVMDVHVQFMQRLTALPMPLDTESVLRMLRSIVRICLVETVLSLSSIVVWLESCFKSITEAVSPNITGDRC